VGGAIASDTLLGARCSHLSAGLEASPWPRADAASPLGRTITRDTGLQCRVTPADGGSVRGGQHCRTDHFTPEGNASDLKTTPLPVIPRANRMGCAMDPRRYRFQRDGRADHPVRSPFVPAISRSPATCAPSVIEWGECQTTAATLVSGPSFPREPATLAQAASGTRSKFEFITSKCHHARGDAAPFATSRRGGQITPLIATPPNPATCWPYQWWAVASSANRQPFEEEALKCRPSISKTPIWAKLMAHGKWAICDCRFVQIISSSNIACGGHAGDADVSQATMTLGRR